MGKHTSVVVSLEKPKGAGTGVSGTRRRPRVLIPLAALASMAMVMVIAVDPYSGTYANAALPSEWVVSEDTQIVVSSANYVTTADRDGYGVTEPPPPPPPPPPVVVAEPPAAPSASSGSSRSASPSPAPSAGTPDPGSAKEVARSMLSQRGMDDSQYNCLVSLWQKESGWNVFAENKSSGAYGIPQSLPGSKMATAGSDWATNAATQISWGLGYIEARYQTPCGAWTHSQAMNWY